MPFILPDEFLEFSHKLTIDPGSNKCDGAWVFDKNFIERDQS